MKLPRRIGDYEFVRRLGAGGAGTVYETKHHGAMGVVVPVAAKVLRGVGEAAGGRDALFDEARLLSRLQHPNIVRVRDLIVLQDDVLGELPTIVMDLVRGQTVGQLLKGVRVGGALLALGSIVHLLAQAASALGAVHGARDRQGTRLGVVHRDLKPSNLMVNRDGDLRILDFGIAWAEERRVSATRHGQIKGTLRYLSPEALGGLGVDGRTDLYSLGAVAFEMLAGERYVETPPGARSAQVLMALMDTRLPDRLPALRQALGVGRGLGPAEADPWVELLGRLLQLDPGQRLPDARALEVALAALQGRWPPHAGRSALTKLVRGQGSELVGPSSEADTEPFAGE